MATVRLAVTSTGCADMENAQNPTLAYALSLWADWMRNDFSEIRPLWYPAKSLVLEPRQSVTEETDCYEDANVEHRVAIEVNNAVRNLTPTQRYALERSLGLCGAVARVRDFQARLEEAHDRIWRHIISMGCV